MMRWIHVLAAVMICLPTTNSAAQDRFQAKDLLRMRSVGDVQFSPDETRIAYTIVNNDGEGRPYSQVWVMELASGKGRRVGGDTSRGSGPAWSPDGTRIAYVGRAADRPGLFVARLDGSEPEFLAPVLGTNSSALLNTGKDIAWAPDGKRIAFVHATPGPETADVEGDPVVITRYLYKPTASEGNTRFNDNRRLHLFVIDLDTKTVRQLTDGVYYEHSIDWSPNGEELLFVSNREPKPDDFFNNDLFVVKVSDGSIRRLTLTESAEYQPKWSPNGKTISYQATKRGLTDLETTMEDTHIWVMDAGGGNRRELGAAIDNRQGPPEWSPDGSAVYFTVEERGNVRLYRVSTSSGKPEAVLAEPGTIGAFSVGRKNKEIAYVYTSPRDFAQLHLKNESGTRPLTALNADMLAGKQLAATEAFTFISNDNKHEVEAFLTKPLGMTPTSKHPLVVVIHGGPHGQQGPAFNFPNQVYAAQEWGTLMVNFRGSTGYGQAWSDAVFRDQNGDEAQDVLYGLGAAMRRNLWIDRDRLGVEGGSYGGQLSAWLITTTAMFKAAIPRWPITNLVSYNYMTYYNMYEEMEFGVKPHVADWMDQLWRRSSLRYVANVKTPTLLMHGENDNDVPIAESEQFYIALKDVGVETVMVRYPREGHGLREPKHVVDMIERSIRWYEKHFPAAAPSNAAAGERKPGN